MTRSELRREALEIVDRLWAGTSIRTGGSSTHDLRDDAVRLRALNRMIARHDADLNTGLLSSRQRRDD